MTAAELRIIEFLMSSNATRPADLPDWLLILIEVDAEEPPTHELITTALLMFVRRERPGISFAEARNVIAGYSDDLSKLKEMWGRITAFRLSCCLERLKRAGRYDDVFVGDPFDPDGEVSVVLTEAECRARNEGSPLFHMSLDPRRN